MGIQEHNPQIRRRRSIHRGTSVVRGTFRDERGGEKRSGQVNLRGKLHRERLMILQMEQKLQYARWKAADIAKALKEGRKPDPGPRKLRIKLEAYVRLETQAHAVHVYLLS